MWAAIPLPCCSWQHPSGGGQTEVCFNSPVGQNENLVLLAFVCPGHTHISWCIRFLPVFRYCKESVWLCTWFWHMVVAVHKDKSFWTLYVSLWLLQISFTVGIMLGNTQEYFRALNTASKRCSLMAQSAAGTWLECAKKVFQFLLVWVYSIHTTTPFPPRQYKASINNKLSTLDNSPEVPSCAPAW